MESAEDESRIGELMFIAGGEDGAERLDVKMGQCMRWKTVSSWAPAQMSVYLYLCMCEEVLVFIATHNIKLAQSREQKNVWWYFCSCNCTSVYIDATAAVVEEKKLVLGTGNGHAAGRWAVRGE